MARPLAGSKTFKTPKIRFKHLTLGSSKPTCSMVSSQRMYTLPLINSKGNKISFSSPFLAPIDFYRVHFIGNTCEDAFCVFFLFTYGVLGGLWSQKRHFLCFQRRGCRQKRQCDLGIHRELWMFSHTTVPAVEIVEILHALL